MMQKPVGVRLPVFLDLDMKTTKNKITQEKENGRIYTPMYIVTTILDLSNYSGSGILNKHVMDNSCGDGAFLVEIVRRYCSEAIKAGESARQTACELSKYVHGIELDPEECGKCIENVDNIAASFGINGVTWDILCADTLKTDLYNGKMDFVLGNPPYVRVHNLGDSFHDIKKFSFAQEGMTDLFIVFYEIGLRMLNDTGTLGYITPSSFFNSIAGKTMRKVFCEENLLEKVIDLKHFQAFNATTYTTIIILNKNPHTFTTKYFEFDTESKKPFYVESLKNNDFYISGNFYFAKKEKLDLLKRVFNNHGQCDAQVKNGYATLCDSVFISDFDFESKYIIPAVKSSKGIYKKIIYPYDTHAKLIPEDEIKKDSKLYDYLSSHKEDLTRRSNENEEDQYWYAFGRSQALLDTYSDKIAINSLIRDKNDLKFVKAPSGVGVYSGLYIVSDTIPMEDIVEVMKNDEFVTYVTLLSKYKSGGYYTYSSKDVKAYLDYKFAYDGGAFLC